MAQINPSRGVVDFNGYRALQPLFDAAMEAGVWIILRPGEFHVVVLPIHLKPKLIARLDQAP